MQVTGLLYVAVSIYLNQGVNREKSPLLWPFIHSLILGITGAFYTRDLFNLYVWFEVTLISSFVLSALNADKLRLASSLKYTLISILGSLLFLAGAGFTYNATHTLDWESQSSFGSVVRKRSLVCWTCWDGSLCRFFYKSGDFPLFAWLPASYHNFSPALSGLFAGLLTKLGLYGIFRICIDVFPANDYVATVLVVLSCISMVIGVAGAILQKHFRRILSFHIVSQVGYISLAAESHSHPMIRCVLEL